MRVNIVLPLACVTPFLDGQAFAEHQSGRSWLVIEKAHNSCTT